MAAAKSVSKRKYSASNQNNTEVIESPGTSENRENYDELLGDIANDADTSDEEVDDYEEESSSGYDDSDDDGNEIEDENNEKEGSDDGEDEEEHVDEDEDSEQDEGEEGGSDSGTVYSEESDTENDSGSEQSDNSKQIVLSKKKISKPKGDSNRSKKKKILKEKTTISKEDKDDSGEQSVKDEYNRSIKTKILKEDTAISEEDKDDRGEQSVKDEYEGGDTSDEEDIRNTVGNIPMNWYDEYPHIGYDWEGKKILKPSHIDQLDYFLKRMEDPDFWRTVKDPQTGQDVVLSDKDVDLIRRLESQKIPDEAFDEYAPWIDWFTSEVMKTPLRKFPEHKRSFLPSVHEKRKIAKFVHALKMGWMKPSKVIAREEKKKREQGPQFYMLWKGDDVAEEMRRIRNHIPAPKRQLPGHSESYNPPAEYLFNEKELKKFNREKKSLGNKKLHYIPRKYNSLREVPAYARFIRERFLRCIDLYMCPRAIKMKLTIEPEDLVPQLPSPKDLQPFPTVQALIYSGHKDMVRCISVDPRGQYLVSGSDDHSVKFWEISTARCLKTVPAGGVVRSVAWCPNQSLSLVAVAADRKCLLINPGLGDNLVVEKTDALLQEAPPQQGIVSERVKVAIQWEQPEGDLWDSGIRIIVNHFKDVKQVTWHGRGDYFATVMPEGANRSVLIHQLSKRRSQIPFNKSKGLVQCVLFHPVRPYFFVATQRNVRIYDLVKQEMFKKLTSNCKWISSMSIHPGGDNLLVGTYDRRVLWFDLDLSTKPYKTLRLHNTAVRSVCYHRRYPLFASVSDDRSLIISHGMVYNDLLQNALIVPLKRLCHHEEVDDFGIFDVLFHPSQPWVFTSGADATIRLYS